MGTQSRHKTSSGVIHHNQGQQQKSPTNCLTWKHSDEDRRKRKSKKQSIDRRKLKKNRVVRFFSMANDREDFASQI